MTTSPTGPLVPWVLSGGPCLNVGLPGLRTGVVKHDEGPTVCTVIAFDGWRSRSRDDPPG